MMIATHYCQQTVHSASYHQQEGYHQKAKLMSLPRSPRFNCEILCEKAPIELLMPLTRSVSIDYASVDGCTIIGHMLLFRKMIALSTARSKDIMLTCWKSSCPLPHWQQDSTLLVLCRVRDKINELDAERTEGVGASGCDRIKTIRLEANNFYLLFVEALEKDSSGCSTCVTAEVHMW